MKPAVLALLLIARTGASRARDDVIFAGGGVGGDRPRRAVARRCRGRCGSPPRARSRPRAGFAFTPDHRRWGEFHAQLSRVPRAGSSVMLEIGDQPFLLVARGDWAWSRGPAAGAGDHRRAARCARRCGSKRATAPGAGSPIPICSTARRPRSTPRRRAARFAALAKSAEHHLDSAPRHECRHRPDADPRARSIPCPFRARRSRARRRPGRAGRPVEGRRSAPRSRRPGSSRGRRSCAPSRSGTGSTIAASAISPR